MKLDLIKKEIKNNLATKRIAFRLSNDDLKTFLNRIKDVPIKNYFEYVLDNFNDIEEFKNCNRFLYKYTKEKSYTVILSLKHEKKLRKISKDNFQWTGNIMRLIVLKTINKE